MTVTRQKAAAGILSTVMFCAAIEYTSSYHIDALLEMFWVFGYLFVALWHIWLPETFHGWLTLAFFPHAVVKETTLQRAGWYMLLAPCLFILLYHAYMMCHG